jgi:hypothetical protein
MKPILSPDDKLFPINVNFIYNCRLSAIRELEGKALLHAWEHQRRGGHFAIRSNAVFNKFK